VLELRGLKRRYGDVVALDDVSFTVREGQMFGFIGPNGAGKTTAMRIILGVLEADAGEVLWQGRPMDDEARRRVGYMPEDHGQTFFRQFAPMWKTPSRPTCSTRSAPRTRHGPEICRSCAAAASTAAHQVPRKRRVPPWLGLPAG
jgi:ABC-type cobalamin/Fe3+-siderophores transport system ATPase subunit